MACIELRPEQRLDALDRQPHCRGHAYVISDRLTHRHVLLTQRLPKAAEFLASQYEDDPPNMASLYEAATAKLRSGLHHRRWRVLRVPVDEAPQEFERERRAGYLHPVVLAQRQDQMHFA
jgi:hypothetical protein